MLMKIIAYRRSDDLDVQFENGAIATNKTYTNFRKGNIKPPDLRIGEVSFANNGMQMKIIAYRSCTDIDIQFEDGVVVEHKSYKKFKEGKIGYPNFYLKNRVGLSIINKEGHRMTIIEYRGSSDIDVQFEDGTIVKNKKYCNFCNGAITKQKPLKPRATKSKPSVGEEAVNIDGSKMRIINYRSSLDIDVQFDDGTVLYNKNYSSFKNGSLINPNNRVGEKVVASNGMEIKIIAYRGANDIDVQFEDGYIADHVQYSNFKKGTIRNPNCPTTMPKRESKYQKDVGKKFILNNGFTVKILNISEEKQGIDTRVDIMFEDGTVLKGVLYKNVKNGKVGYPGFNTRKENIIKERVGQTSRNTDGELMTLVAYRGFDDVDIQFEDGTIVEHRAYKSFRDGAVLKPKNNRLGEESIAKNGMKIKIIAYRKAEDIDVQFSDGTVVKNTRYFAFKNGLVPYPNKSMLIMENRYKDRVFCSSTGLRFKVINYISSIDVKIMFEDGTTRKVRQNNLRKGRVAHPQYVKAFYGGRFYDFYDIKRAYSIGDEVYYMCKNIEGEKLLLTPQQMMEKSGVKPVF